VITMNKTLTALSLAVALLAAGIVVGWGLASWRGGAVHDGPSVTGAVTPDTATPTAGERKVLYWYDPMVPTQKFDKPGKSPFMDMQLVPRYADEGDSATPGVAVSSQAAQSLGVRLAAVEKRLVGAAIDAVGTVQLNERDISIVQARTAGFVERVYARAPGDAGADPLAGRPRGGSRGAGGPPARDALRARARRLFALALESRAAEPRRRVLLLHSFNYSFPATSVIAEAARKRLVERWAGYCRTSIETSWPFWTLACTWTRPQ
jgi:hypothetical protein